MIHAFLEDPENARAYAHLLAVPIGSVRTWAKALGWSPGKMQRYIAALRRYRLGSVDACQQHSVFRPLSGDEKSQRDKTSHPPKVHRSVSDRIDAHRCVSAPLGSSGLGVKEPSAAGSEYSSALITAMNDALAARFPETYRQVLLDNRSSITAAVKLELAGVPIEKAIEHLEKQVRQFNPSTHGKGDLPHSLAYFRQGILNAFLEESQLKLFPKLDMQVVAPVPEYKPEKTDRPLAGAETIAAGVEEFRAIANSSHKPQRMK